jgi:hypothetical protein
MKQKSFSEFITSEKLDEKRIVSFYEANEVSKSGELINWGRTNKFPEVAQKAIFDSGTAAACVARIAQFIEGKGFLNSDFGKIKVNGEQTAADLLSDLAQGGFWNAFAVRVLYNNAGKPSEFYKVPVSRLRAATNGGFYYKDSWTKSKETEIYFHKFNPELPIEKRLQQMDAEIEKFGRQMGEILFYHQPSEADESGRYPSPAWISGLEDVETDSSLQRLDRRNVKKGFKGKVIISLPYQLSDEVERDENGNAKGPSEADQFSEEIRKFVNEDGAEVMVLEGRNNDARPEVTTLNAAVLLNGTNEIRKNISAAVARHFGVPPVILGQDVAAILGNTQALANSIKLFIETISGLQRMIERLFSDLIPGANWAIAPLSLFEFIPAEVYAKMNADEIRALSGLPPVPEKVAGSAEIILNALNSLSPLVANKVLEKMTDEEIRSLVGLQTVQNQNS